MLYSSAIAGADTVAAVRPIVSAKAAVIKIALTIAVIVIPLMTSVSMSGDYSRTR